MPQFEALKTEFWSAQTVFEIKFAQSESVLNTQQQQLQRGNNCQFDCISRLPSNKCQKAFISYRWNSFYAKYFLQMNFAWSNFGTGFVRNSLKNYLYKLNAGIQQRFDDRNSTNFHLKIFYFIQFVLQGIEWIEFCTFYPNYIKMVCWAVAWGVFRLLF